MGDSLCVLGIEGTAWAASAAVFETPDPTEPSAAEHVAIETEAYQPDSGGIHPREAAEHMAEAIPRVVEAALDEARHRRPDGERDAGSADPPIDAVAFSRGPGLGPCLRIVGTAARAVAGRYDVPLVGVNHMLAHLEIGRHLAGFADPVCCNASGANAHLLAFRRGHYRVLGETMDTGVGNAIDKFTRHLDWAHPGGPKVERAAAEGEYVPLPYVVKGMDFSFSGLSSAAQQAVDDGTPVEDVCAGLQETAFAMLTESAERALALTDGDELVLGGGVAQNRRLQAMMATMCEQRGADCYVPEDRFLRDNAGMIAVLGAKMYAAGDTIPVADSGVDPNFRPDQADVTWREPVGEAVTAAGDGERSGAAPDRSAPSSAAVVQGAEATVRRVGDAVVKTRAPKAYRHPALDDRLRTERTRQEARLLADARRAGVPTPLVRDVDLERHRLVLQHVGDAELRDALTVPRVRRVGRLLARCHEAGLVHGDPTTRNVRVRHDVAPRSPESADGDGPENASGPENADGPENGDEPGNGDGTDNGGGHDPPAVALVDFGLGYYSQDAEDRAMDLHVLERSLDGTSDDPDRLRDAALAGYDAERGDPGPVHDSLDDIAGRGRYQ